MGQNTDTAVQARGDWVTKTLCRYRVLLLSQLTGATDTGASYEVQEFRDAPGLYSEKVGSPSLYTDVWTIAIRLNLMHLVDLKSFTEHFLEGYRERCRESVGSNNHCGEMINHLDRLSAEIKASMGVVHDLVGAEHPRRRRGLVDGLGSIVRSITGNLDATDGARIDAELAAIRGTQDTMREGMRQQVQVVESALAIFNRTSHTAQRNLVKLYGTVREANAYFTNRTGRMETRQQHDEGLALLEAYVETLLREIKGIAELFASVASGAVSPALVTPERLTEYLTDALPHIPRGHSFPRPVTRENGVALLRMATAKAYRKMDNVTLLLEIPLIGPAGFSIHRVYPLPRRGVNNTYYCLEASEEFVVVDRDNRNYLRITGEDLRDCKTDGDRFLCNPRHPVLAVSTDAPCSVSMLIEGTVGQERQCPKRAIELTLTLLVSTKRQGRWLYVAPHDEAISVACEGEPTQQRILRGTGSLTVRAKCVVSAKDFRVETARRLVQEVNDNGYVPTYNLTLTDDEEERIPWATGVGEGATLEHIVSNPEELNALGTRIREVGRHLDDIPSARMPLHHIIGPYAIGALALVAVAAYVLYNGVSQRCKRRAAHEPACVRRSVETAETA